MKERKEREKKNRYLVLVMSGLSENSSYHIIHSKKGKQRRKKRKKKRKRDNRRPRECIFISFTQSLSSPAPPGSQHHLLEKPATPPKALLDACVLKPRDVYENGPLFSANARVTSFNTPWGQFNTPPTPLNFPDIV